MRFRLIPVLIAMALSVELFGQSAVPEGNKTNASKFAGVWRGQFDNLPGVVLVITDEDGQLHGAVLFYLHIRPDVQSPYTSTPELPEPLFKMKVERQTLEFEVSHRRAHPPRTLQDPPVAFELKLVGADKAELVNKAEGNGPAVVLTRKDY
jgi:hypothetical protein